jgi:hypothetical protein
MLGDVCTPTFITVIVQTAKLWTQSVHQCVVTSDSECGIDTQRNTISINQTGNSVICNNTDEPEVK